MSSLGARSLAPQGSRPRLHRSYRGAQSRGGGPIEVGVAEPRHPPYLQAFAAGCSYARISPQKEFLIQMTETGYVTLSHSKSPIDIAAIATEATLTPDFVYSK